MWFSQYGRAWSGPWFLIVGDLALVYVAGRMLLLDLPTTVLTMGDRGGLVAVDDR